MIVDKKRWGRRALRKIFNFIPSGCLSVNNSWNWLRYYPAVIPDQRCFNEWNRVEKKKLWESYKKWININSLSTLDDWFVLQEQACHWKSAPTISIVTPVYNTQVDVLYECIISVRTQTYPYWQFILVDDGSSNSETLALLKSGACIDPRIKVIFNDRTQGISKASNTAIEQAQGDYVVFLDHDDRLSLDALFSIAEEIKLHPAVDIIYSDRDMITPKGKRYMHLFKPDWSPETLLSGNYIFHLMCYRRNLLTQLGGLRSELDGSQDYDLILRAAETQPQVRHIEKVLYHWRQYEGSVSLVAEAKEYAFEAGIKALNQALKRRGIQAKAKEIDSLWRGNYQLEMDCPDINEIELISIASGLPFDAYRRVINLAVQETDFRKPYIALMSDSLTQISENAIAHLATWTKIDGVGLASGSIMTAENKIEYTGATYINEGCLYSLFQGFSETEMGYMAVNRLVRNISAPHPFCVLIRSELWQQLGGLDKQYDGFYALLDFALKALESNWRCVSAPQAQFVNQGEQLLAKFPEEDKTRFYKTWQSWLEKGDPYYNSNFDNTLDAPFHLNT